MDFGKNVGYPPWGKACLVAKARWSIFFQDTEHASCTTSADLRCGHISSMLNTAIGVPDRKRILASLAAESNRCEFGYVVAQAYVSYPGLESRAKQAADELARDLAINPQKLLCWGEYEGVCDGKKGKAMVVPEKHEGRDFMYRIRVVGEGIDTSMEGRLDKDGVSFDSQGWKGEIRKNTPQAASASFLVRRLFCFPALPLGCCCESSSRQVLPRRNFR